MRNPVPAPSFPAVPSGDPDAVRGMAQVITQTQTHLEDALASIHAADTTLHAGWQSVAAVAYQQDSAGLARITNVAVQDCGDAVSALSTYAKLLEETQSELRPLRQAFDHAMRHDDPDSAATAAAKANAQLEVFSAGAAAAALVLNGLDMGSMPGYDRQYGGEINHTKLPAWGIYVDSQSNATSPDDLTDLFLIAAGPAEALGKVLASIGKDALGDVGRSALEGIAKELGIDTGNAELDSAAGRAALIKQIESRANELGGPEVLQRLVSAGGKAAVGAVRALPGEIRSQAVDTIVAILKTHSIEVPDDLVESIKEFLGENNESYLHSIEENFDKFSKWIIAKYGQTGQSISDAVESVIDLLP